MSAALTYDGRSRVFRRNRYHDLDLFLLLRLLRLHRIRAEVDHGR